MDCNAVNDVKRIVRFDCMCGACCSVREELQKQEDQKMGSYMLFPTTTQFQTLEDRSVVADNPFQYVSNGLASIATTQTVPTIAGQYVYTCPPVKSQEFDIRRAIEQQYQQQIDILSAQVAELKASKEQQKTPQQQIESAIKERSERKIRL